MRFGDQMAITLTNLPTPVANFLCSPPWKLLLAFLLATFFGDNFSTLFDEPTQEADPTSLAIVSLGGYMAWKGSRKPDQKLKKKEDETEILATVLKNETKKIHETVESHPFIQNLLNGKIKKETYALYLRDLLEIYRALEKGLTTHKNHPKVKHIYFPELFRSSAIEKDLDAFQGNLIKPTPAALSYAEHLNHLSNKDPALLAAHAYTRYLGDLSGGQILGKAVKKQWGDKINYHTFPEIKSLVETKKNFRNGLNSLPLTATEKKQVAEEALLAFRMASSIFDEVSN